MTARKGELPKYSSTGEWVNKIRYVTELFSHKKERSMLMLQYG
jgi:hypothetical protein